METQEKTNQNFSNTNIENILKVDNFISEPDTKIMNILNKLGYKEEWHKYPYEEEKSYVLDRVVDIVREFLEHINDNEIIFNEDGDISN